MNQYVVANWKMNGSFVQIQALVNELGQSINGHEDSAQNIIVCPPAPYMQFVHNRLAEFGWRLGAQDCSNREHGAFTGQVSASMLKDVGCSHAIIGHSERRQYCHETNTLIAEKMQRCTDADIIPIICLGETLEHYETGQTLDVIATQIREVLNNVTNSKFFMMAYEPVWSIGTGKVPTNDEIAKVHEHIRMTLNQLGFGDSTIPILYGGSVNGDNAASIMNLQNVDGVLVGGASLKARDFSKIIGNVINVS